MNNFWHFEKENFFEGLAEEKEAFLALTQRKELKKNESVFLEGDAGTTCFYIESGLVRIFGESSGGKESTLFLRQAGEIFGLAEIMSLTPRAVSAQALCASVIHTISQANFERLLREHFTLVRRVISILGQRLRYMGTHLTNQNEDVSHRLAFLLITIAYDNLKEREDWETPCPLPHAISQSQLATMIRSTQPTVSAALQEFRNKGLVTTQEHRIVLLNPLAIIRILEK